MSDFSKVGRVTSRDALREIARVLDGKAIGGGLVLLATYDPEIDPELCLAVHDPETGASIDFSLSARFGGYA